MGVIMIQAAEATQPKPGRLPDHRALPLGVGTRGSPLALWQARHFIQLLGDACPALRDGGLREQIIATTGDAVLDRPLADIGGKGLFAKEIHGALLDNRIDFAVHSRAAARRRAGLHAETGGSAGYADPERAVREADGA
jgi:hydroxymethylbilane synthase